MSDSMVGNLHIIAVQHTRFIIQCEKMEAILDCAVSVSTHKLLIHSLLRFSATQILLRTAQNTFYFIQTI